MQRQAQNENATNTKRSKWCKALLHGTVIAIATAVTSPTIAETGNAKRINEVEFDGSKARVNQSGRLQMLNQKIAAAACQIKVGWNTLQAKEDLYLAQFEFAQIVKGLRESDPSIGIPTRETKARILSSIWDLEQNWVKVKYAGEKLLADDRIGQYVDVVGELAENQVGLLDNLGSEILAQYTNPAELLTGDGLTINVAGRQRMLSQKMAKHTCGVATKQASFGRQEDLEKTISLFDKSLSALENGLPAAGIAAPPNDFISGKLTEVRIKWAHTSYTALQGSKTEQDVAVKGQQFKSLLKEMDNLVTLYMLATPGQQDVYKTPLKSFAEKELSKWTTNPTLITAIHAQNSAHANLTQSQIDTLDKQWRAEVKSDGAKPLVDRLLSTAPSQWLAEQQVGSGGLVTEVFVMDNKGLNVAQSAATSDYWQGDEAKWKETFLKAAEHPHISEVEFDDSTGSYQSQVSMAIRDPQTNEVIGAITFGMNVQSFL